ncbi:MAG TPA: PhzF family phenazine biosynthesis protein [Solirubrobacteraceae bacterium]|nr:PhzF family phenazine biosynthesis protein [Solirubrobacteraceae bacterium]
MAVWPDRIARFDPFAAGVETLRYVLLDVFTDVPLTGNQLAVFTDGRALTAPTMQAIAAELKLSETVFLLPPEQGGDARARIFTPAAELPFAGHPLLGAAVVLGGALRREELLLETAAGPVPVALAPGAGSVRSGEMSQPVPTWAPFARAQETLAALGCVRSELPVLEYVNGPGHVMVALPDEAAVAALEPDMRALARAAGKSGVSCFAGGGGRFKSRMFAPGLGVEEDPATGSAAGPLAVHCARHGLSAFGAQIEIRQGAEVGRPSLLRARAEGSAAGVDSVHVGGSAVVLARAEMRAV